MNALCENLNTLSKKLARKKVYTEEELRKSELARVLNLTDLSALGIGSTLGVGIYVLAGDVSRNITGPAVIISFLVAAVASLFAGLCYAEFGARVPKAGSAYVYSFVSVGEFIAFTIGWNLILEYVIGTASVARAFSSYLDSSFNYTMARHMRETMPIDIDFLASFPDFLAFGMSILLAVLLALGVKESSLFNSVVTVINMVVVLFFIIAGSFKADSKNWNIKKEDIPEEYNGGEGGFLPFGVSSIIRGAATCFYGFVGFDVIATTGEEAKNPQKTIPLAILISLLVVFLSYFGLSTVLTLILPYYLQDVNAPLPHVFDEIGWSYAKWIVIAGALCGLSSSLFGGMFPLPRIIYAMSSDGLLFEFLGRVNTRFHTPVIATLISGVFTGAMALIFNLEELVDMMSIGTLLAYTLVAACVLLLRVIFDMGVLVHVFYSIIRSLGLCFFVIFTQQHTLYRLSLLLFFPDLEEKCLFWCAEFVVKCRLSLWSGSSLTQQDACSLPGHGVAWFECDESDEDVIVYEESTGLVTSRENRTLSVVLRQIFCMGRNERPTSLSYSIVKWEIFIFCILCICVGAIIMSGGHDIYNGDVGMLSLLVVFAVLTVLMLLLMALQPTSKKKLAFSVPWVPVIPGCSIFINVYLMLMLDSNTWIRFGVWMAVGMCIYFTYSVRKPLPPVKQRVFQKPVLYVDEADTSSEAHVPEIVIELATPMPSRRRLSGEIEEERFYAEFEKQRKQPDDVTNMDADVLNNNVTCDNENYAEEELPLESNLNDIPISYHSDISQPVLSEKLIIVAHNCINNCFCPAWEQNTSGKELAEETRRWLACNGRSCALSDSMFSVETAPLSLSRNLSDPLQNHILSVHEIIDKCLLGKSTSDKYPSDNIARQEEVPPTVADIPSEITDSCGDSSNEESSQSNGKNHQEVQKYNSNIPPVKIDKVDKYIPKQTHEINNLIRKRLPHNPSKDGHVIEETKGTIDAEEMVSESNKQQEVSVRDAIRKFGGSGNSKRPTILIRSKSTQSGKDSENNSHVGFKNVRLFDENNFLGSEINFEIEDRQKNADNNDATTNVNRAKILRNLSAPNLAEMAEKTESPRDSDFLEKLNTLMKSRVEASAMPRNKIDMKPTVRSESPKSDKSVPIKKDSVVDDAELSKDDFRNKLEALLKVPSSPKDAQVISRTFPRKKSEVRNESGSEERLGLHKLQMQNVFSAIKSMKLMDEVRSKRTESSSTTNNEVPVLNDESSESNAETANSQTVSSSNTSKEEFTPSWISSLPDPVIQSDTRELRCSVDLGPVRIMAGISDALVSNDIEDFTDFTDLNTVTIKL